MDRLKKILIDPDMKMDKALRRMDEAAAKILFVVDHNQIIIGIVNDGDIRRWIIKGKQLDEKISKVMNRDPICLDSGHSAEQAKDLMVSKRVECIPVVDDNRRIISAIWWPDLFETGPEKADVLDVPVVIMAGGEGTRLAPYTNILPKPLMPIKEKPIIELIIEKFVEHGCGKFYLSLNYKSNLIKAYFSDIDHEYEVQYIEEEAPLGTAGSLSLLKHRINTTFFVSNCDILIEADYADFLEYHLTQKNKITLVGSMKHFSIPYGICEIANGGKLRKIQEKPEYNFVVNTGMYILEPETLADIPKNKVFHLTDLVNAYIKKGKKVGVYPVSEKSWLDIGQFEELQNVLDRFKES